MKNKIVFKRKDGEDQLTFYFHHIKCINQHFESQFRDYLYNNLICELLILTNDYEKRYFSELSDHIEILEEGGYIFESVLNYISIQHKKIKESMNDFLKLRGLIDDLWLNYFEAQWKLKIVQNHEDWMIIRNISSKILSNLGITGDIDTYLELSSDMDFMFE